jgi:TolA-binding protein
MVKMSLHHFWRLSMADFDSNEFYPHEKRGGLDRLKEKLSVAQEAREKAQRKMDELESEIRDLNEKIFELEDGRLLQAIKNILKSGKSPNVAQEVKSELEKIDLGAVIRPGKKPKVVKGSTKLPKAAKVPVTVHLAASPVNPSPIGMPTSKTPPTK